MYNKLPAPPAGTSLEGKIVIVTGGNSGIGFDCARQIVQLQVSRLIITSRDKKRGEEAASKLRAGTRGKGIVEMWLLDMCSPDSVQQFARKVECECPRLDIAILNAGLSKTHFDIIEGTGYEECFQVNYLSTMLLVIPLLPVPKHRSTPGEPARLTLISSGTVYLSKFLGNPPSSLLKAFRDPSTAPQTDMPVYSTSKIYGIMFIDRLAQHISPNDVIINLADPGGTKGTEFGRDLPRIAQVIGLPVINLIARSVIDAAHAYLDAALVKGKESHGCFIMDAEIRPQVSPDSSDNMHSA